MYPALYVHPTYKPNGGFDVDIISMRFNSLFDAVLFASQTQIALRESNWFVYECGFLKKNRISLRTLYNMGLFAKEIAQDSIGIYYNWKTPDIN